MVYLAGFVDIKYFSCQNMLNFSNVHQLQLKTMIIMDVGPLEDINLKQEGYYQKVRKEILPLIPQDIHSVLEIGCGFGNTLEYLKSNLGLRWIGGVEISDRAVQEAKLKLDCMIQGDVEAMELPFKKNSIDIILLLDVLEHLRDPWKMLRRLHPLLTDEGAIIASIPSVRHYSVILPLLFRGEWRYRQEGILDATHLRFFTRNSAIQLMESSGLSVDKIIASGIDKPSKMYYVNRLSLQLLQPFLEMHYLMRAVNIRS